MILNDIEWCSLVKDFEKLSTFREEPLNNLKITWKSCHVQCCPVKDLWDLIQLQMFTNILWMIFWYWIVLLHWPTPTPLQFGHKNQESTRLSCPGDCPRSTAHWRSPRASPTPNDPLGSSRPTSFRQRQNDKTQSILDFFFGKNHRRFFKTLSMACIKWCIRCLVPLRSLALGEAPALQSSCRTASKPSVSDLTISNLFPNSLFEGIF